MVGTEHLSAVLSDSQALRARLLRLVVATAYTQEYAAELLERLDLRSGRAMGDSTRARQLADACRESRCGCARCHPNASKQPSLAISTCAPSARSRSRTHRWR